MTNKKIITFCLLVISFSSCKLPSFIKNHKKEVRKEKKIEKKLEKGKIDSLDIVKKDTLKIPQIDTQQARKLTTFRNLIYKNCQLKTKMEYEANGKNYNFTTSFRLEKNKIIWASIQAPLIGEVARAIITPDSVKATDRFNKRYFLYTYKDIQKIINLEVEFNTLQDIIIGNSFAIDGNITDVKNLNQTSSIIINGKDYINQLTYNMVDTSLKQIQLQTTRNISKSSVLVMFSKYMLLDNYFVSSERTYYVQDIKGAASLNMEVTKIELNSENLEYPFTIPSSYKPAKSK